MKLVARQVSFILLFAIKFLCLIRRYSSPAQYERNGRSGQMARLLFERTVERSYVRAIMPEGLLRQNRGWSKTGCVRQCITVVSMCPGCHPTCTQVGLTYGGRVGQ